MKFRTQLIISMVFFALALAIISASVIATNQQVERLNKQEELTKNIELKVGELSYLSNDYLLYHESQQIDRWESKYSSISEDVSNLTVDRPEQQVHVNNIKTSEQQLKEIFGDIISKINSASSLQQNTVDPSFIQISSSRLGVQTQGILFDASRLSLMLRDQANQTQQRNTTFVFSLIGAFIALLLANYLIFYRGTLRSIEFLQTGTGIIGSGNLDFSLDEKRNDEIGELSRSFNLMTANLKTVTASKTDLEREIVEREQAEHELAAARDRIASDLDAMTRLHEISTRFVSQDDIHTVLDEIVETAIVITHADMGNMQLFDANSGSLKIMAYNGFEQPFLDYWNSVHEGKGACGTALGRGERVIVEDVTKSPIFAGTPALQVQLNAGVRAVQSTPLLSRSDNLLGMLSTHYRTCHRPEVQDLRLLDLLARLTADIVEHRQVEQTLRENERKYSLLFERSAVAAALTKLPENVFVDINGAFEKLFGYTRQEVVGKTSLELGISKPEEHGVTVAEIEGRGLQLDAEKHVRTKSGVERIILLNVNVLELGDQRYTISTMQDITERKKAEEALRESEEKFRGLFDSMNQAIQLCELVWNEEGRPVDNIILDVNPAYEKHSGLTREQVVGRRIKKILPVVEQSWLDRYGEVVRTRKPMHFEEYNAALDQWFDVDASPMEGNRFVAIFSDITERKRAEEALQDSERRERERAEELAAVLEAVPTPVIITDDPECTHLIGNPAANELLRLPSGGEISLTEPLERRPHHYKAVKEGRELRLDELPVRRAAKGENVQGFEYTIVFDDGSRRELVAYGKPLRDDQGNPRGAVHTLVDITERKRAEEELRASEERMRLAAEAAEVGTFSYDFESGEGYWSTELKALLGLKTDEPVRVDAEGLVIGIHPEDRASSLSALKAACDPRGDGRFEIEYRFVRPDDSIQWLRVSGRIDFKGEGEGRRPWHSAGATIDITERKRAEQALQKAKDELEQRVQERTAELSDAKDNLETINEELQVEVSEHENTEKNLLKAKETAEAAVEAKSAFLANMSHELRTPMNAVIGFSNLLLDDSLTPDQKDYIERIKVGGEALLGLINDILDFSKMEKNRAQLEHQPLSLRSLVDESLDMVVVQARDKGLNLAFTINYGTPDTIIGDHGRLRQILVNLLSNAIKFTDAGEVSVSISSKLKENNRHQILFSVNDTGMGIPKDKIDTLFQPFSQVETTISSHRGGTGLGLAISKRLVELMGGKIWVESEQGKGSTFSFSIEADVAHRLPTRPETPDKSVENLAEQHPLRILVAEDVPSNQKVLVEMLKRMGYRADMAADGVEVLQALERQPYDLVLMDVKMPEMDGIAAAKEIRRLWPNNGPKVVAITAYAMEGDREKCLEAGMDDYIAKPVQKGELAEVLRNINPSAMGNIYDER